MCLDLNGFKEAISQQESEEENGCGLIVFGVTFLCLSMRSYDAAAEEDRREMAASTVPERN